MSEQTARLVDRLRRRLRAAVRRVTLADLAYGAVVTLGAAAAGWLLSVLVEAGFWLASPARLAMAGVLFLFIAALTAYFVARPALRLAGLLSGPSDEAAAHRIGTHFPMVSDRLVNLLQLAGGRRSHSSDAMVDRAVRRLGEEIEPVAFEEIEDFGKARRASRWAVLPLAGLLLFLIAAPNTFFSASQRLLAPATHFQRPAPFRLSVAPGDVELVKGDSLTITIRAAGHALPEQLTLALHRAHEEQAEEITLSADSTGTFRHTLANVRVPLRYRATAAPVQTAWHLVAVRERPLVQRLQLTLHPPAYTGRPVRRLPPNVGDVTALAGTRVALDVALGGPPVAHASLAFSDGARDTLQVQNGTATGAFTLRHPGHYRLLLESRTGTRNRDPIRHALEVQPDAAPTITLLAPQADVALDEDLRTFLHARIADDFGFSRLRLYYRLTERRFGEPMEAFEAIDLSLPSSEQRAREIRYEWHLPETTGLDLLPGDVVAYYVQVWDNNRVAGFQSARTPVQHLRVPSLAQRYAHLNREQRQTEEQMRSLLKKEHAVREQFDALRKELRRQRGADWEDERQLDLLRKQQRELQEGVEELSRQIEAVNREMRANDLVSPETMRLYEELQRAVQEVQTPELQDALRKLQKALRDMDLQQMHQALQQFSFNETQYRERLERTLALFERLRVQQKLDEVVRRTEALRKQEERLAEQTQRLREKKEADPSDGEPQPANPQNDPAAERTERADSSRSSSGAAQDRRQGAETKREALAREQDLAREQERARTAMRELEQQLDSLAAQMAQVKNTPRQQMQQFARQLQKQNLPQRMRRNSRQLRQGRLQQAQQGQQNMAQRLQAAQKRLQQMRSSMQGRRKRMNVAGLKRALDNTLRLSRQQEALHKKTRSLSPESPATRQAAQRQQQLAEGLRTVSDSLQQLARGVPQMSRAVQRQTGQALRNMQSATQALSKRLVQQAAGSQKASMTQLNQLALSLSRLLSQLMNGQGQGSGMSMQQMAQQLRKMARQQGRLNSQLQQFLNDVQGNRLAANQARRLRQMAAQQQALKRRLDELRKQGVAEKALGDLGRIAEQMQETIDELRRRQYDRRTIERQQQIRTRLLDAQRSLRRRGRDPKQRQARRPEGDFLRESPSELTLEEQADSLHRALLRALESGYAPDYEALIRRYFELLQERQ